MKKKTQKPQKIFVTLTGRYLVGSVQKRGPGQIVLNGPAFVEIAADQARFNFTPIKFASKSFTLYLTGLLGEMEMPEIMRAGFEAYLESLPGK